MKKLIIIKYGELSTKKGNIEYFIKILKKNILGKLINFNIDVNYDKNRMFITLKDDNYDEVMSVLKKIFGIHEIIIGYEIETDDLEIIGVKINELIANHNFKTFKISAKRSNKQYPITSPEINKILGGIVLENNKVNVDVHHPDLEINVEIRLKKTYVYFDKLRGSGGYPVGSLGKGLLMLSGGIDSPVAGYLAMKRGIKLEAIYFEALPHTSMQARNKVLALAQKISEYGHEVKVHIINFTPIEEAIYKNIPPNYLITIMRRMMYRISAIIASKYRAHVIINGESIGQVASQTLTSMQVINEVIKIPVIRPVACLDKLEIIELAKKIDTYDTSILPYEDCCTIFVPEHPIINPNLRSCYEYEKLIDYPQMIHECIKEHEIITMKDDKFNDVL